MSTLIGKAQYYAGLENDLPKYLEPGALFVSTDTGNLYFYDKGRKPSLVQTPLSAANQQTLAAITYDELTDKLKTNRTIDSDGASYEIGGIWALLSAYRTPVFTNSETKASYTPVLEGVKDQTVLANRDETGVIPASVYDYGDYYAYEPAGVADPSLTVQFNGSFSAPDNIAVYSLKMIIEQEILLNQIMVLKIYDAPFGNLVYEEQLKGNAISSGTEFTWNLNHPLIGMNGDMIYISILVYDGNVPGPAEPDTGLYLVVRASNADPLRVYSELGLRYWVKKELATQEYVAQEIAAIPPPTGDMLESVYDPTNISGDAFNMNNMYETTNAKIMTLAERNTLSTIGPQVSTNTNNITLNTASIGTNASDISINLGLISVNINEIGSLQNNDTLQDAAIALNTAKVSYDEALKVASNETRSIDNEDNIAILDNRVTINEVDIIALEDNDVLQDDAIALNTLKVSYDEAQKVQDNEDRSIQNAASISALDQEIQDVTVIAVANETQNIIQDDAIALNTAKISYDEAAKVEGNYQRSLINETDNLTQDGLIGSLTANEIIQDNAIALNTAKISYPSADALKLQGIEPFAEVNQTDAEIRIQVGNATDSNVFTDADKNFLDSIALYSKGFYHESEAPGVPGNTVLSGSGYVPAVQLTQVNTNQYFTGNGAGLITYTGPDVRKFMISSSFWAIGAGNDKMCRAQYYLNGVTPLGGLSAFEMHGTKMYASSAMNIIYDLNPNDTIQIWVANVENNDNLTEFYSSTVITEI